MCDTGAEMQRQMGKHLYSVTTAVLGRHGSKSLMFNQEERGPDLL